jgi:hypothetical protein
MLNRDLDSVRRSVLDRMERSERLARWAIIAAAVVEALLFVVAFLIIDWDDRLHLLLFVLSVLSYWIISLGLIALGAHVSRSAGRILAALESGGPR